MSTALKVAVFARLTGTELLDGAGLQAQQDLAKLLTWDINTGAPVPGTAVADHVFPGNKNDAPLVYPLITFREGPGGMVDQRFSDGAYAVDMPLIDMEIWDNSRSGTLISDIDDAVERLLDRRRGAIPLPLTSGRCFYLTSFTTLASFYDDRLHAWFGLKRYKFVEGR